MNEVFGLHGSFSSSLVGNVLGRDTDELWWMTDVQCGTFCIIDRREVEAHVEKFWFNVPAFEKHSVGTLRPGALSAGAHLMGWDESAYLLGFSAENEAEAILLAPEL